MTTHPFSKRPNIAKVKIACKIKNMKHYALILTTLLSFLIPVLSWGEDYQYDLTPHAWPKSEQG